MVITEVIHSAEETMLAAAKFKIRSTYVEDKAGYSLLLHPPTIPSLVGELLKLHYLLEGMPSTCACWCLLICKERERE